MAPELFDRGGTGLYGSNPSEKSDVYSLAITAFEVIAFQPRGSRHPQISCSHCQILSEVLPYGPGRESLIVFNIVSGKSLPRPNSAVADRWLSDLIWDALQHCWNLNPDSRWPIKFLRRAFTKQTDRNTTSTGEQIPTLVPPQGISQSLTRPIQPRTKPKAPRFGKVSEMVRRVTKSEGVPSQALSSAPRQSRLSEQSNHAGSTDHLWGLTQQRLEAGALLDYPSGGQVLEALKELSVLFPPLGSRTLRSQILAGKGQSSRSHPSTIDI